MSFLGSLSRLASLRGLVFLGDHEDRTGLDDRGLGRASRGSYDGERAVIRLSESDRLSERMRRMW